MPSSTHLSELGEIEPHPLPRPAFLGGALGIPDSSRTAILHVKAKWPHPIAVTGIRITDANTSGKDGNKDLIRNRLRQTKSRQGLASRTWKDEHGNAHVFSTR